MKINPAILMVTALLTACSTPHDNYNIRWETSEILPTQKNGEKHIGVAGPITGIIGNRLIVAGGANFPEKKPWEGGIKNYAKEIYIYKIEDNSLSLQNQQTLQDGIAYSGTCSVNDTIYFAGGENIQGASAQVKKLFIKKDSIFEDEIAPLPVALTNGSLVATGNKLYYIGGENQDIVSDKVYLLDLSKPKSQWVMTHALPYAVSNAVVVSNNKDTIYIAGGRKRNVGSTSTIYDSVLAIDLASDNIEEITKLPEPLAAGTGVLGGSGELLIFGGDNGETFHKVEAIIAEIGATEDNEKKEILNVQKAQLQSNHPGFSNKSWSYSFELKKWFQLNAIPQKSPVTTSALRLDNLIIIPSGEISAGVRTDQLLVGIIERN